MCNVEEHPLFNHGYIFVIDLRRFKPSSDKQTPHQVLADTQQNSLSAAWRSLIIYQTNRKPTAGDDDRADHIADISVTVH